VDSALGPVLIAATARGVCHVELRADTRGVTTALTRRFGSPVDTRDLSDSAHDSAPTPGLQAARGQLAAGRQAVRDVLAGPTAAATLVPLDWTGLSTFDRRVLEEVRRLGWGEAINYGTLASRIGAPRAARAVGSALGRNPFWMLVPCHRVVAAGGRIGGYGHEPGAQELKRDLLAREGVAVSLISGASRGRGSGGRGSGGRGPRSGASTSQLRTAGRIG
jgi:methylated-DNA-[protein]-cysteine S-methyltransferase